MLNAVLDGGINLIDTSPDYGRSEELIGSHVGHRRDEFFLASKCGCPIKAPADMPPPYPHDYSPANVRADVEQSLRRLRTDQLDLVQVHMSPSRQALEENRTLETLRELRREGKIRFIGMSGILPHLVDHLAMDAFDAFQIPYSAVQRDHESLIDQAGEQGAGTLIRGGAARGAASAEKNWRTGPLTQQPGLGQRNWETWASRTCSTRRASPRWSSSCASPSATRACPPRSWARPTRPTSPPTSPSRKRARCPPTCTRRPGSACLPPPHSP